MPEKRAVYAGSFDPPTNGHLWMIKQAAMVFDSLVVAVGENPSKKPMFTVTDRRAMLETITAHLPNVRVAHFENTFLVKFAASVGASYIVRGLRNTTDYNFERDMRHLNTDIAPSIHTWFLMPERSMAEVSSSTIKGMIGPDGWENVVRKYVPDVVLLKLIEVYHARTP